MIVKEEKAQRGDDSTAQQQSRERLDEVGSLVLIMARNSIINFFWGHPEVFYKKCAFS